MNLYAWSYATLWSTALRAAAGRGRDETPAPSPREQPRRRQLTLEKQLRRSPYIPPIDPPQLVRIATVNASLAAGHNGSRSLCRICAGAYSADA